MNKDKEWLKAEVENILYGIELRGQVAVTSEGSSIYYAIEKKIDELYESEVKQLHKKIKELDSYNDELIRDNNQLRNELNNQEVLSQEFIDEHEQCITGHGADKNGMSQYHHAPFVSVYDLQNLLVPKQNKPVIPKFVAGWIEQYIEYGYDLYPALKKMENNSRSWIRIYEWYRENTFEFVIAYLTKEYEVEKEKKYRVTFNLTEWNDEASELEEYSVFLALDVTSDETLIITSRNGIGDYRTDLTEPQIKAIDERYWAFAEEVTK